MTGIVWLASYPKSGNTWLRLALRSLAEGGGPVDINADWERFGHAASRLLFDQELEIESSDLTGAEIDSARRLLYQRLAARPGPPLILKVHDARLPAAAGERNLPVAAAGERNLPAAAGEMLLPAAEAVIHVVRDPRDVAISFAHHMNVGIDEAITVLAAEDFTFSARTDRLAPNMRQCLSSWSRHTESWLDTPDMPVCQVRYEDMQSDMAAVLTRVAPVAGIAAEAGHVARAVRATCFAALRSQEEREGFRERMSKREYFFRRGIAGGWREILTPAQAERIVQDHGRVMERLGYPV